MKLELTLGEAQSILEQLPPELRKRVQDVIDATPTREYHRGRCRRCNSIVERHAGEDWINPGSGSKLCKKRKDMACDPSVYRTLLEEAPTSKVQDYASGGLVLTPPAAYGPLSVAGTATSWPLPTSVEYRVFDHNGSVLSANTMPAAVGTGSVFSVPAIYGGGTIQMTVY